MSNSFRSAVAFRNDICESIADLKQRFTRPLPAAATVYVEDTSALYRLAKGLGSSFDALVDRIIVPADGSSDRWVQESVYGSNPWAGVEVATATNNVAAAGASTWTPVGGTPGSFQLSSGDTTVFEVNPTSSLLTYRGVPRFMMATSIATLTAAGDDLLSCVIAKNGDVPADATPQYLKGEQGASNATNGRVCITTQRAMFLAPGDTLRLMLRSADGGQAFQVRQFSLSVAPQ